MVGENWMTYLFREEQGRIFFKEEQGPLGGLLKRLYLGFYLAEFVHFSYEGGELDAGFF